MKRFILTFATLAVFSAPVFADHEEGHEEGPCRRIKELCEAKGFVKGGHENGKSKGLFMDCMKPILQEKKSIPGVDVSDGLREACIRHKERMKEHKGPQGKEGKDPVGKDQGKSENKSK
jgi:hypothetical protein